MTWNTPNSNLPVFLLFKIKVIITCAPRHAMRIEHDIAQMCQNFAQFGAHWNSIDHTRRAPSKRDSFRLLGSHKIHVLPCSLAASPTPVTGCISLA